MNIQIADNSILTVGAVLNSALANAEDVRMAVAFASTSGLQLVEPALKTSLERGTHLEFLVGLDMRVTEPQALRYLFDLSRQNERLGVYCFVSTNPEEVYHPKVYLLRSGDEVVALVGSSNLTRGGLSSNVEVNLVLQASIHDEIVSDLYSTYSRLKFHPKRVIPDEELLDLYSQLYERGTSHRWSMGKDDRSAALMRDFNEKARTLQRPRATARDLAGWSQLIYSILPDGEFTNRQVYESEAILAARYPDNRNIRAKIRQQLQVLRDIGLLEHAGKGRWRKLGSLA